MFRFILVVEESRGSGIWFAAFDSGVQGFGHPICISTSLQMARDHAPLQELHLQLVAPIPPDAVQRAGQLAYKPVAAFIVVPKEHLLDS